MSKVSIYLSSYNHAKYLRDAIDSVLNQSFSDFELFIEDDASTDESWFIIQSYTDPRIQAHRNSQNQNDLEWMRKVILDMAMGEYIAIHHSDDIWEPEKLQKQVDFMDANPQFGAVFTNAQIIDENGKRFKDKSHFYYRIFDQPNRNRYEWLNFFFYNGNALCHPSVLIRKTCYDECGFYRSGLNQIGDYDMWVRLCLKYEIHVIPEKLVRFRVRTNEMNTSGNRPEVRIRRQFEFLQVLDSYLKIPTYQELVKIFPAAQKYYRQDGYDIGYVLAMVALEVKNGTTIYSLFGLKLLFEAINNHDRARRINELYGFTQKEFIELTAKYDVFSSELNTSLYSQLAEKERDVQALTAQSVEKEQVVQSLSVQIAEKEQAVQYLTAQVVEKEQQAVSLQQQHSDREQVLQTVQAQLDESELQTATIQKQLAEREQFTVDLQEKLEEGERKAHTLQTKLIKKQKELQALQAKIIDREHQLKVLTDQLAEQDHQFSATSSQKSILQQELTGLKDRLDQREQILQDLNSKLLEIYSSTAWNIIVLMWKVRLWLAPKGSKREKLGRSLIGFVKKTPLRIPESKEKELINGSALKNKKLKDQCWAIMATPHTLYVAYIIAERLRAHDCTVTITTSQTNDFSLDYYIVICPQMFSSLPPGEKRIVFQMEQSVSSRWFTAEYLQILNESLSVLEYSLHNIEYLATQRIAYPHVYYLPIGASTSYGSTNSRPEKIYDVLFYGDSHSSPRRKQMLDALKEKYKVKIASEVFGLNIVDIIRQSRVVINLHFYENAILEIPRIQECLSLGIQVVSETAQDQDDYPEIVPAVRFFKEGSIPAMLQAIEEAIHNPISDDCIISTVKQSVKRFEFMFDRFLIGMGFLPDSHIQRMSLPTLSSQVVLSLPETIARRRVSQSMCPQNYSIFDGIRKSPGWIGCGLSYSALAYKALENHINRLTIMEDDALLPEDFQQKMSIVHEYLNNREGDWDIFVGTVASLHPGTKILNVELFKGIHFITINKMTSTVCNIYNEKSLRLLSLWNPDNLDVHSNTIDRYLENQNDIRVVVCLPFLVGHREELNSTIWGFQNIQYHDMVNASQRELQAKVWAYKATKVDTV